MKLLLGVTGSVATTLLPKLVDKLYENGIYDIKIVATESARNFFNPYTTEFLNVFPNIYYDRDEWITYENEQKVLHIDLVKWADVFLIAPCSANTLAKLSNGICDNLLTCCARARSRDKPLIFAPAMNSNMFTNPITKDQIGKLLCYPFNYRYIPPISKTLYCGDTGIGALANIDDIVRIVKEYE